MSDRSTASYCTASHKQKAYRWRKKLAAQKLRALQAVDELASYLNFDKTTPTATLALSDVRTRIYEILLENNVKVVG